MQLPLPREVSPGLPGTSVDAGPTVVSGLGTSAGVPFAPVALPIIVPPIGLGGPGLAIQPGLPSAPKASGTHAKHATAPKARQNPSAFGASNDLPPASFRAGYRDYLRTAGLQQLMAAAVPGVTGIMALTAAGSLLGYRQARAGHTIRVSGAARFMG